MNNLRRRLAGEDSSSLPGPNYPSPEYYSISSLKPSLAVVIGILAVMFVLTFLLLIYAKFCHGRRRSSSSSPATGDQNSPNNVSEGERFSGVDKRLIESLPFFRFSTLKGNKEGLECAVCLSRFADVEILRMLPKCKHAFHVSCIDMWLEKHSTCPLCRRRVGSGDLSLVISSFREEEEEGERREEKEDDCYDDFELFVRREDQRSSSSRFSIGRSFRNKKIIDCGDKTSDNKMMVSRWSDVGSSEKLVLMASAPNRAEFLMNICSGQRRSVSEITAVPRIIDQQRQSLGFGNSRSQESLDV